MINTHTHIYTVVGAWCGAKQAIGSYDTGGTARGMDIYTAMIAYSRQEGDPVVRSLDIVTVAASLLASLCGRVFKWLLRRGLPAARGRSGDMRRGETHIVDF